jgi:hypothetical protein
MYEATDILNLCHLKAMEHGSSSIDAGCFNPLLFCMQNPSHAHVIGTHIKVLNLRLDTIKEWSAALSGPMRSIVARCTQIVMAILGAGRQGSSTGRVLLGTRLKKTQEHMCPRLCI